jgi:uncharacterized protein DUF6931/type III secretion system (T3SS) inner membrane Yop/YscD-like protein
MRVILQVTTGAATGKRVYLRAGQVLNVGRTEWADFSLPQDASLADVHFALKCEPTGCVLKTIASGNTLVNDEPVAEAWLNDGDQIVAGATRFTIGIEGQSAADPASSGGGVNGAGGARRAAAGRPPERTAEQVCQKLELSPEAKALLTPELEPQPFVEILIEKQRCIDAMGVLAHLLPKRQSVWWACQCVRHMGLPLAAIDQAALDAAEQWVADPSEANRRAAQSAAEPTKYRTAAGWAATAAFWSAGSLSHPNLPEVPPADELTGKAVNAALMIAASAGEPIKIPEYYAAFCRLGLEIVAGQKLWPKT